MDIEKNPILSPEAMCEDGDISMSTWRRNYRFTLPIIRISPRRIGVRQSDWRKALEEATESGRPK
ncbi:MAG: hypothetical protein K0R41_1303 [Geminicoccaceae bacterium]|jgi:hypothetical protein|nr:hypothetical protein [Geminicoccaceae bacterium]